MTSEFPSGKTSGFSCVDKAPIGTSWYLEYLKRVSEVPAIKEYKRKELGVIDPQSGESILDIGCGIGADLQTVYKYAPGVKSLVGIDNSQAMIDQAISLITSEQLSAEIFRFQQGDAHKLSFEDETFNTSYSDRTFQHLKNPFQAFDEMLRVTKVGGKIIVADTDWGTLQLKGLSSETAEKIRKTYQGIILNPNLAGTLQDVFTKNGLKDVEVVENRIELPDLQTLKDVLGLEESLKLAGVSGILSKEDIDESMKEINQAQGTVQASFAIYIVRGVK